MPEDDRGKCRGYRCTCPQYSYLVTVGGLGQCVCGHTRNTHTKEKHDR